MTSQANNDLLTDCYVITASKRQCKLSWLNLSCFNRLVRIYKVDARFWLISKIYRYNNLLYYQFKKYAIAQVVTLRWQSPAGSGAPEHCSGFFVFMYKYTEIITQIATRHANVWRQSLTI